MVDDREKYDFKGSNIVILLVVGIVLFIRYLEIITWSWYFVIPLALGAAVIVAALVSTVRFITRVY